MFPFIYEILFAGYHRGFTMFKLLCLELVMLSICNMFRISINKRWPEMAWISEVIGTFETGFIFYTEAVMFSIGDLRYYVMVLFVNAMFTFLVNNYQVQTWKHEHQRDPTGLAEIDVLLGCVKKRLLHFFNRLVIMIASMFFMKHIILLALSSEFECDDLSCMVTCERFVTLFSSDFWFVALSEAIFTFIVEWAYCEGVLEGIARDSVNSIVKIFFISICFYLGFPVKIIDLNPFTAYLFLNVCELNDIPSHLMMHSLFPMLGVLAVCLVRYIKHEPTNIQSGDEKRKPNNPSDKSLMEEASGDHHHHNSGVHANNNSKHNHHDPNFHRRRHRTEDLSSPGSDSSEDDDDDDDDDDGEVNVNNCTKSDMYEDGDDNDEGTSSSEISYSPPHHMRRAHRPGCPKLMRHFSDTSLTENRRKQKRKDNHYCCKHEKILNVQKCPHHCHRIKEDITDDRSNSYRKNFSFKNIQADAEDSDDSRDSIYEDIVQPRSTKKHHVHDLGMQRPQHRSPLKEFNNNIYCDHNHYHHHNHCEKSHRYPLKEYFKNSEMKQSGHCYDKESKDGRSCKSGQKMLKPDFENNFPEDHKAYNVDHKVPPLKKRFDFESEENVRIESQHRHHANCMKNNFPVCRHKHSTRQPLRNLEPQNSEDFHKDEFLNQQRSSKANLKPCHKHRHVNECGGNVENFDAYIKHDPKAHQRMPNHSFDKSEVCPKHGRYRTGDVRHLVPYREANNVKTKRISRAEEENSFEDFENHRKVRHQRQTLYANKTQNAKDPLHHKRSSTPVASSATYSVDHSPTDQDKNPRVVSHRHSNASTRRKKFADENDDFIKSWKHDACNDLKSMDQSKDRQNETLRKLFMAKENILPREDHNYKVKHDISSREICGRHKDVKVHRHGRNGSSTKSDDSSTRSLNFDGDHSNRCRRRCSHLYDIFESDES